MMIYRKNIKLPDCKKITTKLMVWIPQIFQPNKDSK